MAAQNDSQEKTEAPTARKREEARKEGTVAMSREVPSAILLFALSLYLAIIGPFMLEQMISLFQETLSNLVKDDLSISNLTTIFYGLIQSFFFIVIGLLGFLFLLALLATSIQVGLIISPLKAQFNRLDPIQGLKRIFSLNSLNELVKNMLKLTIVGSVMYFSINNELPIIFSLPSMSVESIFSITMTILGKMGIWTALAMLTIALLDYLFQRWQTDRKLMMTKQEVKEELRQTEGDPHQRSRIKQIQREMSKARMMQDVPKSDVVVTNPTHYAVALQYDREAMEAPKLLAKGKGTIAQRIREIALENDIPIVQNPPVARSIHDQVDIGNEIPEQLFKAVAEILAYVYRLKNKPVN